MGSLNFKHTVKIIFVLLALAMAGCSQATPHRTVQMYKGKLAEQLAEAVAHGNIDAAKKLIGNGADVNAVDGKGRSLLALAIYADQPEMLELLLDAGADVTYKEPGVNSTAVHFAAEMTEHPIFLRLLLEHGAPVDIIGNTGITPLFSALQPGTPDTNLKMLISHGADVNHADSMGNTALMKAASTNDYDGILLLLKHDANPTAVNKRGDTFQVYLGNRPKEAYTPRALEFMEEIRQYLTAHHVKVTF